MSDSSMAYSQIQLEAIRQAISDGRLTAQQIHSILLEEITNELNKPKEEVDTEYISACQELLGSLNRSRTAAVVSHYEENLQAIRNKMQPRFSFSPCIREETHMPSSISCWKVCLEQRVCRLSITLPDRACLSLEIRSSMFITLTQYMAG